MPACQRLHQMLCCWLVRLHAARYATLEVHEHVLTLQIPHLCHDWVHYKLAHADIQQSYTMQVHANCIRQQPGHVTPGGVGSTCGTTGAKKHQADSHQQPAWARLQSHLSCNANHTNATQQDADCASGPAAQDTKQCQTGTPTADTLNNPNSSPQRIMPACCTTTAQHSG